MVGKQWWRERLDLSIIQYELTIEIIIRQCQLVEILSDRTVGIRMNLPLRIAPPDVLNIVLGSTQLNAMHQFNDCIFTFTHAHEIRPL